MKIAFVAVAAIAAALLAVHAGLNPARACTVPLNCESSAETAGGVLLVCPAGDGPTLESIGATIHITLLYCLPPMPLVWMPPQDIWIQTPVYPWDDRFCVGNGSAAVNADAPSDANGQTTISGAIAACGYFDDPLYVFAGGVLLESDATCDNPLPLILVSPDINADHVVDIVDFSLFGGVFSAGGTDPHMDFNGDGLVDLIDVSLFGQHFTHTCGQ